MQNQEKNEDIQLVSDSQNKAAVLLHCLHFILCLFWGFINAERLILMLKHWL